MNINYFRVTDLACRVSPRSTSTPSNKINEPVNGSKFELINHGPRTPRPLPAACSRCGSVVVVGVVTKCSCRCCSARFALSVQQASAFRAILLKTCGVHICPCSGALILRCVTQFASVQQYHPPLHHCCNTSLLPLRS